MNNIQPITIVWNVSHRICNSQTLWETRVRFYALSVKPFLEIQHVTTFIRCGRIAQKRTSSSVCWQYALHAHSTARHSLDCGNVLRSNIRNELLAEIRVRQTSHFVGWWGNTFSGESPLLTPLNCPVVRTQEFIRPLEPYMQVLIENMAKIRPNLLFALDEGIVDLLLDWRCILRLTLDKSRGDFRVFSNRTCAIASAITSIFSFLHISLADVIGSRCGKVIKYEILLELQNRLAQEYFSRDRHLKKA